MVHALISLLFLFPKFLTLNFVQKHLTPSNIHPSHSPFQSQESQPPRSRASGQQDSSSISSDWGWSGGILLLIFFFPASSPTLTLHSHHITAQFHY